MDGTMLLLVAALLLMRLSMVAGYPFFCRVMPEWAWTNNDGYDAIAVNWVETGIFALETGIPTAARLPAYPALIAVCYALSGAACP